MTNSILRVFEGDHIINLLVRPRVAERLLNRFKGMENEGPTEPLSGQKMVMLGYFANGYSREPVSHVTGVSEQELMNRMASIVSKLAANERT